MSALLATSLYQWLIFLHVLAAMAWVGGLVTLAAIADHILQNGDDEAIARFSASLRVIGPLTLAPATVAVVALGIGLVLDSKHSWTFSQGWIVLALAVYAAAFLIGAAFQSRTAIRMQRSSTAGDHDEAARQLRRWAWGG